MPFQQEHYLLAFGGPLFTNEQWSCTLRSFVEGGTAQDEVLDAITTVLSTWYGAQPVCRNNSALKWVKWNRVGLDGKYSSLSTTGYRELTTGVTGTSTGVSSPPQVSVVATLRTARERGLASRGRIFLPNPSAVLGPDGLATVAWCTAAAQSVATLLTNLNAVPGVGGIGVFSNTREGASEPVTGVQVGRVLDTLRSRRASLGEEPPPPSPVGGS